VGPILSLIHVAVDVRISGNSPVGICILYIFVWDLISDPY
jgi:hypothetical protein